MTFTPRETECRDPDRLLSRSLEPVIAGMGMSLVELSVFRSKRRAKNPGEKPERRAGREKTRREISGDTPPAKLPGVSIRLVVYKDGIIGVDDCSRVHRGITPRLELAFPGQDIYLEVSSPGIDRVIKDGGEFVHYIGQGVRCYRTDISDWTAGILEAADEKGIVLREEKGETILPYEVIAKARLDGALPRHGGAGMTAPERGINKNGTGG